MLLSLLDRTRTRAGSPPASALNATVERAEHAEQVGYQRFWVAEHHGVPGIASGAPAVLLAAVGAHTTRIRLGSGGVMLPNHQPIVVAEQFLMLDALYPGRVDLGIGRSLCFTPPVRDALRTSGSVNSFSDDIAELQGFLGGTAPVSAQPAAQSTIPVFVLATKEGIDIAAALGLPVVVGGPALHTDALDEYRRRFVPSAQVQKPYVIVSTDVLIADTDAAAADLALPEAFALAQSRHTGEFPPLESPEGIRSGTVSARVKDAAQQGVDAGIHGTVATVESRLNQLFDATGADELLASSSTFDREALFESDRLLAGLLG